MPRRGRLERAIPRRESVTSFPEWRRLVAEILVTQWDPHRTLAAKRGVQAYTDLAGSIVAMFDAGGTDDEVERFLAGEEKGATLDLDVSAARRRALVVAMHRSARSAVDARPV
jgi:hypothetical protein